LNASIPRDVKVPEGSGGRESSRASQRATPQRAVSEETAVHRGKPGTAGELKADRAGRRTGRERSGRSGALTLEWRPLREGSRCRRAKGRYERPAPLGSKTAECREALILGRRNQPKGSRTAGLSARLSAMFNAVHAGSEQGWKSVRNERKVRSPQGSVPANGRGNLKGSTESATENIPPRHKVR